MQRLVEAFYDRIEMDAELRALFPADLGPGRERQQWFLEQWLGGEPRYSRERGEPFLRRRHFPFVITEAAAERWLSHMAAALSELARSGVGVDESATAEVMQRLRPLALQMVNADDDVPREPYDPHEERAPGPIQID